MSMSKVPLLQNHQRLRPEDGRDLKESTSPENGQFKLYDYANMKKNGAGLWTAMYFFASSASTYDIEGRRYTAKSFKHMSNNFKCNTCKEHFSKYVKDNDPEDVIGTPDGLFFWVITFNNAVTSRVLANSGVTPMLLDPDIMYSIFYDTSVGTCSKGCSNETRKLESKEVEGFDSISIGNMTLYNRKFLDSNENNNNDYNVSYSKGSYPIHKPLNRGIVLNKK